MTKVDEQKKACEPILKWPGGKRWLVQQLSELLSEELGNFYFEPFLGGAAMYLSIEPKNAFLSDTNEQLIEFYLTCIRFSEEVIARARQFSNSEDVYYRVRSSNPTSPIGRAARFLYLNRTCWGGIFRMNQKGVFNVPFGNSGRIICNKAAVVESAMILRNANFSCCDFQEAFSDAGKGDVIFADPPYTSRGQFNGFVRYNEKLFSWRDQVRLSTSAKAARKRGTFVAVCGSYHRDVLGLYENWWVIETKRASAVARRLDARKQVSECVIFSRKPKIEIPDVFRITADLIQSVPFHED